MKVLIIEDDINKINQVTLNLMENFSDYEIEQKFSYQSGLKSILKKEHNLILLDMSMPNFDITQTDDGGRPKAFAGKEILRQMKRRQIKIPVIIITQFEKFGEISNRTSVEELTEQLATNYKPNFKGIVHYNPSEKDWVTDLIAFVNEVQLGE